MSEWILILWIFSGSATGGSDVHHIPSWKSESVCSAAGKAYVASVRMGGRGVGGFACVRKR